MLKSANGILKNVICNLSVHHKKYVVSARFYKSNKHEHTQNWANLTDYSPNLIKYLLIWALINSNKGRKAFLRVLSARERQKSSPKCTDSCLTGKQMSCQFSAACQLQSYTCVKPVLGADILFETPPPAKSFLFFAPSAQNRRIFCLRKLKDEATNYWQDKEPRSFKKETRTSS